MSANSLQELSYTDLYVRLDELDQALYLPRQRGKIRHNMVVPEEFRARTDALANHINNHVQTVDAAIEFDGIRMRVSKQTLADGQTWVCLRRINTEVPNLDKLGMNPALLGHLKTLGARDGLILVAGSTGAGKTTTAAGLLAYFLREYGGTAVTIEDPAEYMMKGRHGVGGFCFQVEIKGGEEGWADGLKRALRWAPRYIFVGEIRTPKAAEQLLRAATTGHTVITTVHAGAIEEALMGLQHLAEMSMGQGAEMMLAAGMTAILYQTMTENGPQIKYVYTEENAPGDPVRALIRDKKTGMISTYVERTAARLSGQSVPPAGGGQPIPAGMPRPAGTPPMPKAAPFNPLAGKTGK